MSGWITLHRQIKNHWIWEDPQRLKWWLDILLRANHKDNKILFNGELITIKRGSFHTSEVKLSEQWGVSRNRVRRFLTLLETDSMVRTFKTINGTTIEVLNYNTYQGFSDENKQPTEQPSKQQVEQPTEQQTEQQADSRRNTNNNDNNDLTMNNNDNNNNTTPPSENKNQDYAALVQHLEKCGFGAISPNTYEDIQYWLDTFDKEMVLEAINIADYNGKNFWNYPKGILRRWKQANLKTLAEVKAHETKENYTPKTEQESESMRQHREQQRIQAEHMKKIMADEDMEDLPF